MDALPGIVRKYMDKINAITGKDYKFFNYYGHPEADRLIVVMGSGALVEETIDELMRRGEGRHGQRASVAAPSCRKSCWKPSPPP
ncbi:MAG: hypothetical protein ACLSAH_04050 [Bilophila wadsworthia]